MTNEITTDGPATLPAVLAGTGEKAAPVTHGPPHTGRAPAVGGLRGFVARSPGSAGRFPLGEVLAGLGVGLVGVGDRLLDRLGPPQAVARHSPSRCVDAVVEKQTNPTEESGPDRVPDR